MLFRKRLVGGPNAGRLTLDLDISPVPACSTSKANQATGPRLRMQPQVDHRARAVLSTRLRANNLRTDDALPHKVGAGCLCENEQENCGHDPLSHSPRRITPWSG